MSESNPSGNPSPPPPKTILLVDDNEIILTVYSGALERRGYNVVTSGDGLDALRKVVAIKPDLVVLDLLMPKMDGTYVLSFIRSHPELKSTLVVVLSDATFADAAKSALAQKPDAVFLKSQCTAVLLAAKIKELLAKVPASAAKPEGQ